MTHDSPGMRASDNDRERAADVLKAALAEGRLSYDEHSTRLNDVMTSRTYGELVQVTSDLPGGLGNHPAPMANTWQQPPPGYAPRREPEQLAVASLVLGILGFFTGITAIPAVITGHLALSRIKRNKTEGHGMAVGGLVMGYLAIAIGVVVAIFVVGMIMFVGTSGGFDGGPGGPPPIPADAVPGPGDGPG
ncbi:DUF1707 and DUF4190 domain-containing protein [Tenggerimyces flavus]|uniref:DUF1707 and DUF4190 domain-containing protein n=1 Tax=Tenggerimyces flavus TaxID=1708749 RepID=A0ABV7YBR4_9ACTN|nr:DUF1707 and DUF4190 domain-containing protein [Tenggerimyces flavus]MBM7791349.1 hypothetical protein [Tenggerimyces flavus]